jgi:hypothetical protein
MISPAPAPSNLVRNIRLPGYLILGIAMVLPLLDLLVSVMPLRPSTVVWRFGAVGLYSSAIGAPLLILFFVYVLAQLSGDKKITLFVGVIAALIALSLVAATGAFVLDALQMRQRIQPAAQTRFMTASVQAMLKIALEGLASLVLAFSAFRASRTTKAAVPATRAESGRSGSPMLVSRPSARAVAAEAPEPAPRVSTEE